MQHGAHDRREPFRIRQITGIRIHQLTLPDALLLGARYTQQDDLDISPLPHQTLAGPSSPRLQRTTSSVSHHSLSRRERRISTSTIQDASEITRTRSHSTSLTPASPATRNVRTTRPRAPTLAGEAMGQTVDRSPDVVFEKQEGTGSGSGPRRLARSFITLTVIPPPSTSAPATPRTSRFGSAKSPLSPTTSPTDDKRKRTTSQGSTRPPIRRPTSSSFNIPLSRTISDRPNGTRQARPTISTHSSSSSLKSPLLSPKERPEDITVPFYISPIHHPSIFPRYSSLTTGDFASWMTTEQGASTSVFLEIWQESPSGWQTLEGVGGDIDLNKLRRVEKDTVLGDNTILFSFAPDAKALYYVSADDAPPPEKKKHTVKGIVERSMRETRMKRGVGVGALHQLINIQTVLADVKKEITEVQAKIDRMLLKDLDHRGVKRDVAERKATCAWLSEKTEEVVKATKEVEAHVVLRDEALQERRKLLDQAHQHANLLHGHASELTEKIHSVDAERSAILDSVQHYRTYHVQTLDSLFPILPLQASSLLYSILDVPLPIPVGPKDPAPPFSVPASALPEGVSRIDEKTTAAAFGYVAMVVQILGNLGGATGGIPYPVTCAGNRSLVKDVVSVMQGPRSFPLYAKGVERYRYEYAVFLLNKNIETLMQEANIRLVDLRHTLPNLKVLLLTLSSPVSLPSLSSFPTLSRSTTFYDSRASSRQTSSSWPRPIMSPVGSHTSLSLANTPSPVKAKSRLRRSLVFQSDGGMEEDEKSANGESDDGATATSVSMSMSNMMDTMH